MNPDRATKETENSDLYRFFFDNCSDAVFIYFLKDNVFPGCFIDVNNAACVRLGYTRDELLTLSPLDIVPPNADNQISFRIEELISNGHVLFETEYMTKDGREIPVESHVHLIRFSGRRAALSIAREISDRKRAEAALKEGEEKCRMLMNKAPDAFVVVQDGRLVFCNPRFERLTGISNSSPISRSLEEFIHPDDRPAFINHYLGGKAGKGQAGPHTCRIEDAKGGIAWAEVNRADIVWEGRPAQLFFIHDISAYQYVQDEYQKSRDQLRQQIDLYERSIEAVTHPFYIIDPTNYEIILANSASGLADALRRTCYSVTHGLDKPCSEAGVACPLELIKKTKQPVTVEHVHLDRDGLPLYHRIHAYPILDFQGQVVQVIEYSLDVTKNKLAEKELYRVNRALRTMTACHQVLMRATDEQALLDEICKVIVEVGEYLFVWIGRAERDERKTVRPLAHAGCENGYLENLNVSWANNDLGRGPTGTAIRTGKPTINRRTAEETDYGPWREEALNRGFASSIAIPIILHDTIFGALNIYARVPEAFNDEEVRLLTELSCQLSFGIETLRSQEERKRTEAEKERMQANLRQAQKIEAIGTLAAGIAHDFNNILSAMIGYSQLAMMDLSKDNPLHLHLEQVLKAGRRAKELVRQILTFSRQNEQERQPSELEPIVKEALRFLRASVPTTIEIRQRIEKDTGVVLADPTQIHQVLMNLCLNAVDAMSEGGVLEVDLFKTDLTKDSSPNLEDLIPGTYNVLRVKDTGQGMDRGTMERIFEPFFTTKEKGKGTGMGLAVVHGIVKSYGGALNVTSKPGAGSTFEVYFPGIKTSVTRETETYEPLPGGTERILFIDDEASLVDVGRQILEFLGYRVTVKTNPLEAWETFQAEPNDFDLIVTDMTMPRMTGAALARRIFEIRPDIPIILCTGFSESITEQEAKNLGVSEFIMKPLLAEEMALSVRAALDKTNPKSDPE